MRRSVDSTGLIWTDCILATGKLIRLAIEPEPFCVIETTAETLSFFERLRSRAADADSLDVVNTHWGVCYDVCHQAVEFEDVAASIRSLVANKIRINKVHITCAIEVPTPGPPPRCPAGGAGSIRRAAVSASDICPDKQWRRGQARRSGPVANIVPRAGFPDAEMWRVHFHVPVDAEHLGPLGTTRSELKKALATIPELDYAPHLEVETYTWEVLPGKGPPDIVDGFTRELLATRRLLWPGSL